MPFVIGGGNDQVSNFFISNSHFSHIQMQPDFLMPYQNVVSIPKLVLVLSTLMLTSTFAHLKKDLYILDRHFANYLKMVKQTPLNNFNLKNDFLEFTSPNSHVKEVNAVLNMFNTSKTKVENSGGLPS